MKKTNYLAGKYLAKLALLGALAASAFAAIPATAQTKIDLFFPVPVEGKLAKEMQNMVGRFNKENPDIVATAVYTGSYDETDIKTRAAIKAGKPPAAVIMSANFITEYKINDLVESMDPLLKAEGNSPKNFINQFWPALHANAVIDGQIYGVPFHNSTPLLYYNVEHFKEAGLDPAKPPVTWTEMVDAAKKLTKRDGTNITRYGFMMPSGYDYLGWVMSAFNMTNGGQYFNTEYGGEVYYDTPSMLGAATFVRDLVFKHKVMPEGVTEAKTVHNAFYSGQTSMMLVSTGSLSAVRDAMKQPYKVAFVPRNVQNAVPIGGASLIIPKGLSEDQKKASFKLIKWLTSPTVSGEWSRFTGYFAPNKAAYDTPEMKEFMAKNPDAQVAIDQLVYARPWFATYNTVAVRKTLEDEMQAILSGKKEPAAALKSAQAAADQVMRPYVEQTVLNLPK